MTRPVVGAPSPGIVVLPPVGWNAGAADLLERALYIRTMDIEEAALVEHAMAEHLEAYRGAARHRVHTCHVCAEQWPATRLEVSRFGKHVCACGFASGDAPAARSWWRFWS